MHSVAKNHSWLTKYDQGQEENKGAPSRHGKFRELLFTRQFSTFDRQHQHAANSPFYGFYVLFWIAVVFWIIKMAADNWRKTGSPLGKNEIMKTMFRRDGESLPFQVTCSRYQYFISMHTYYGVYSRLLLWDTA